MLLCALCVGFVMSHKNKNQVSKAVVAERAQSLNSDFSFDKSKLMD